MWKDCIGILNLENQLYLENSFKRVFNLSLSLADRPDSLSTPFKIFRPSKNKNG